ncbi:tyrosine-type recombinase/integrase [Salinarimonas rosea]|uniref:tyrosine-type recombinase/integrase n=1 Tax=Salinarimonas rosea TaxID=552063 RepID=UPI0006947747|nr:site-specific integrase [Salinarimonas rosea]
MKAARAFVESGKAAEAGTSPAAPKGMSVPEATDMWLRICEKEGLNGREPVSSYTLENYAYRAQFIKTYPWPKLTTELTSPDIVAFRSWLLEGRMSRVLASKVLSSFQSVMKELSVRGHILQNAAAGIYIHSDSRYHEPVSIPGKAEVSALLRAADELANARNQTIAKAWQRYRPMLYLAADSGMRPQEYLAVAQSDFDEHGVRVSRAIDGSGRKLSVTKTPAGRRFIDLSDSTLAMVRHYVENHASENDYDLVFPASNGRWMCRKNWQRRGFNVACERAGLVEMVDENGTMVERPKYRPYDLRHFYASMLIQNETNLKRIQTLMGHTNIETTINVYGHLLEEKQCRVNGKSGIISDLV